VCLFRLRLITSFAARQSLVIVRDAAAPREAWNQFHGESLYGSSKNVRGHAMSKAEEAWSRAAICVDRAHAAPSDETRRFFNKLRDSWVRAANNHQLAESLEADIKAPAPRNRRS
jgi:hypothetical protein